MAGVIGSFELLLKVAEHLLAGTHNQADVVQAVRENISDMAGALGSSFPDMTPCYLRTVAGRCRELADALDEEALRLTEETVHGND